MVKINLTGQMEHNLLELFHESIWERALRKRLEREGPFKNKTGKVVKRTFQLSHLKRTNQIFFYDRLSQVAAAQVFPSVRGATLDPRHWQNQLGVKQKHLLHPEEPVVAFFDALLMWKYHPVMVKLLLLQHPRSHSCWGFFCLLFLFFFVFFFLFSGLKMCQVRAWQDGWARYRLQKSQRCSCIASFTVSTSRVESFTSHQVFTWKAWKFPFCGKIWIIEMKWDPWSEAGGLLQLYPRILKFKTFFFFFLKKALK